jgi:hypothetical protein
MTHPRTRRIALIVPIAVVPLAILSAPIALPPHPMLWRLDQLPPRADLQQLERLFGDDHLDFPAGVLWETSSEFVFVEFEEGKMWRWAYGCKRKNFIDDWTIRWQAKTRPKLSQWLTK